MAVTLDDFLTLTLPQRIAWLHSDQGPRGKLSHDRFAEILGTTRQTVIGWEKRGIEPKQYAPALAEFSGFPESAFRRREAEALASQRRVDPMAALDRRLSAVERQLEDLRRLAGAPLQQDGEL